MKSFKPVLAAAAALLSVTLLTSCAPQTPNYAPVPKSVKYSTGLKISKPVQAKINDRTVVANAVRTQIGKFKNAAAAATFTYENVSFNSYDLGANSPYFINGKRTNTTCKAGKALGSDIGEGFYVVGETFITPTTGFTFPAAATDKSMKAAIAALVKSKDVTTKTADAKTAANTYEVTMKDGQKVRLTETVAGANVSSIRVSLMLPLDTCYSLNAIPTTTAQAVTAWKATAKAN